MTAYAVSLIPAVNTRAALGELLKNINYFMAFWMAAEATREIRKPQLLLNVLLASAALVALLGIGAAAGTFDYPGAFMGGRIYSSFQYPNTLATYVTAAFFISMTLLLDCSTNGVNIFTPASILPCCLYSYLHIQGCMAGIPAYIWHVPY